MRSTYFHTFAKKNPFSAWTGRHLFLVLVLNNTYHCRIEKPNQQVFCNQKCPTVLTVQWTEVRFTSFLSGGFITAIVVNPPERKLAKRTSVHSWSWGKLAWSIVPPSDGPMFILIDWGWFGETVHRGAFCQFLFRWIYYCHSSKSTGKETGKTHLCAVVYETQVGYIIFHSLAYLQGVLRSAQRCFLPVSFPVDLLLWQ